MSIFTSITETAKIPAEALRAMPPEVRSQQDADHAAAAVVDNAGQRLLHLLLCIRRHSHQLVDRPSRTMSCRLFPKKFVLQICCGSFSNSSSR